jgi:hypothetical protein
MFRKTLIALTVATIGTALVSTDASAQRGFGGFHAGFAGGGWRGGGWGGGWRGGGWGWGPAAVGLGVGLGIASAAAWGPGWGYAGAGGCTQLQQVWTGWGWRVVPVNVC